MTASTALNLDRSDSARDARLAARGDAEAFERLYRATVGRVHALALRMAGPEQADDLTQEVYIRAWKKMSTFRGEAAFATWLHRLAVNQILSRRAAYRRKEGRQVSGEGLFERISARAARPGIRMDLEAAMRTLPERARDVFVLYDVEGFTHPEIAGLLGITTGTSKSQLNRARMLLRKRLK